MEVSRGLVPDPETQGLGGLSIPDPETFPYEWPRVRQYITMPCFMSVSGKQIESCSEYLKEIIKMNKIILLSFVCRHLGKGGYNSCNVCDMIQILRLLKTSTNLPLVPSSAKALNKAGRHSRVSPSRCPSSVTLWTYDEVT